MATTQARRIEPNAAASTRCRGGKWTEFSEYATNQAVATEQRTDVPQAGAWGLQYVMLNLFRIVGAFLFVIVCDVSSLAQQRSVALTFDDLPVAGTADPVKARSINISILDSLDRHHAPSIGFV